ncbi:hypothetical protein ACQKWADRAFT_295997 [Trichoderma austrokoningii]
MLCFALPCLALPCSVLSRFALPCVVFVLARMKMDLVCPRWHTLLPFATESQDMDMQTGRRLGLLVAEKQASERQRENQKWWPDHASSTWQECPAALGGSLRGLGQQVPANSAEDRQQTGRQAGRRRSILLEAVVKSCFCGLFIVGIVSSR